VEFETKPKEMVSPCGDSVQYTLSPRSVYLTTPFHCIRYTKSNGCIEVDTELEMILNEVVATYYVVLSQHLHGGNDKYHDKSQLGQDGCLLGCSAV
jgi:hypothetical protein